MSTKRNYGIDILKILSMFMVVVLHVLGQGGVLKHALDLTLNDTVAWFIEILCLCSVNLFALTTGYLCIDRKFKYKNVISLYILVLFYNVLCTLFLNGFKIISFVLSFFPVSNYAYWYFSAYIGFILFIPFINKYLNSIDEFEHRKLIYTILFVMCGIGLLCFVHGTDALKLDRGYSPVWLGCLYIIGSYFKLYDFKFKNRSKCLYFMIFLLSSLFALMSRIVILKIPVLSHYLESDLLLEYISFPIVINSIVLFLLFLKVKVNDSFKKVLSFFSGLSFSVYIIHCNPYVWKIIEGVFRNFANMPVFKMIFMVLYTAFVIYVVCNVIDVFRYYLFKILRVDKLSSWLDEKIVSLLTKKG